ncbi:MAG: class I SAM-dependent methyltransferase [Terriglobales bacterium]
MSTSLQQTSASTPGGDEEREEIDRLRRIYDQRSHSKLAQRYLRTNPGHLYALHEREVAMAGLLRAAGLRSLAGLRILDVGCGAGATLRQYLEYEADPDRMWGIDLLPAFVEKARSGSFNLQVICGSASKLPFADSSFDLVSQFMLLTSVLDDRMRNKIAHEVDRVLAPGGKLLWYDFAFNNPSNPDVRGIRLPEVRRLFPGFCMTSRRITLAPPLGRAIGRIGPTLYCLASKMRFLCTHNLCLLEKPAPLVA